MKKLFFSLVLAFAALTAKADGILLTSLTAGAASNLLSGNFIVDNITLISTTTNVTTAKFYDTSNTTTSIVRAAYTSYAGYATNYSVVFTNEANVVMTNSYSGWYTAPTDHTAVTNARPAVYTIQSPASSITSRDIRIATVRGLAVVPDQNCQVAISYKGNP